jgi:transposase
MKQRRNHSPEFKAKVAFEAIREVKTLSDIAIEYNIHPNQVTQWKKEFQDHAASIFLKDHKPKDDNKEKSRFLETIKMDDSTYQAILKRLQQKKL